MSELIIVEGIDGAGKDTYIKKIISDSPDKNYKVVHCTRHTPNTYEYFQKLINSSDNLILNRAMYGQFVYQTKEQRKERGQLTLKQLIDLEETIKRNMLLPGCTVRVVYVYSDIETCLYNCQIDAEDSYYSKEYLESLDLKFRQVLSMSSLDIEYYYNDYHPIEKINPNNIDYINFDYSSLPKVVAVDFDGTLVVGESFPKIGRLNTKLVDLLFKGKYKDYKKILFTHRSGEALLQACTFLADNGIYFDAVNDDILEIKQALNRNAINHRKVWFDVLFDDKANPEDFLYEGDKIYD